MNEYDIIRSMAGRFPRSRRQRNQLFTCDAELIEIGGQLWGLTLDEFTPEEDLFSSEDPELLGANLATATLSDLLAAGAEPEFFMHAVSLPRQADAAFIDRLCGGIKSVLDKVGCFLCGGDIGMAETWRYCGFAMGRLLGDKPLTHILPKEPQMLWVTGQLGDANLAALAGQPTPRFELRLEEAGLARRFGTACIDTSDGFLNAIWLLHTVNPEMRIEVHCDRLPFAPGIPDFAALKGFPKEAALLGGAGEYELLFSTPLFTPGSPNAQAVSAAAKLIATAQSHDKPGVFLYRSSKPIGTMLEAPPCPRDAANVAEHIQDVMQAAQKLFGPGPS
jgi:thiamine-monophosphate kinase